MLLSLLQRRYNVLSHTERAELPPKNVLFAGAPHPTVAMSGPSTLIANPSAYGAEFAWLLSTLERLAAVGAVYNENAGQANTRANFCLTQEAFTAAKAQLSGADAVDYATAVLDGASSAASSSGASNTAAPLVKRWALSEVERRAASKAQKSRKAAKKQAARAAPGAKLAKMERKIKRVKKTVVAAKRKNKGKVNKAKRS
jgi:hypothetical protein